jgi:hypothetical protein
MHKSDPSTGESQASQIIQELLSEVNNPKTKSSEVLAQHSGTGESDTSHQTSTSERSSGPTKYQYYGLAETQTQSHEADDETEQSSSQKENWGSSSSSNQQATAPVAGPSKAVSKAPHLEPKSQSRSQAPLESSKGKKPVCVSQGNLRHPHHSLILPRK